MFQNLKSQDHGTRTVAAVIATLLLLTGLVATILMVTKQKPRTPGDMQRVPELPAGNAVPTPTLSGTVKEVGSDSITFEIIGVPAERGIKYESSTRVARITSDTRIELLTERSGADMMRLLKQYSEDVKNSDPLKRSLPPETHTRKTISLSSVQPGDQIIVTSVENADISATMEFDTSSIRITRNQVPAPATP